MDRAPGLRARPAPLVVVDGPPYRTKVAIAEALDVAVVRDAPNEVALDLVRTSSALEKLPLFFGRGTPEVDRVDPGRHESAGPSRPHSSGSPAAGSALGELAAPALDPPVVVLGGPSPPVRGLVLRRPAHRLVGLAHLRGVDHVLQGFSPSPQPVLRLDRKRRRLRRPGALQSTRLIRRPQRRFDALQLVLQIASLAELPLGLLVLEVEPALGMVGEALARHRPRRAASVMLSRAACRRTWRIDGTVDGAHRLLREPGLVVQAG